MQPYRPCTLQRITQLPWTHCLTGCRDRGSGPRAAWEEWSEGCLLCVVDHGFVKGEGFTDENRELGEEMEKGLC